MAFRDLKCMVSTYNLRNYPHWKIMFTVKYMPDKQLGAAFSPNDKPIALFLIKLSKPHRNHATIEKELLSIV